MILPGWVMQGNKASPSCGIGGAVATRLASSEARSGVLARSSISAVNEIEKSLPRLELGTTPLATTTPQVGPAEVV